MTMGKLVSFSKPQFLIIKMGIIIVPRSLLEFVEDKLDNPHKVCNIMSDDYCVLNAYLAVTLFEVYRPLSNKLK